LSATLAVEVVHGDGLAGQQARAPAEPGRERDLGIAFLEQRPADEVVEGTVEVAAPVQQGVRVSEDARELGLVGAPDLGDYGGHLGIRLNGVGEDRDQAVAIVRDAPVPDIQIEPGEKLAVRARGHQQGPADLEGHRKRVMGVAAQKHVDAFNATRQLAVDVEAVVAQEDDEVGPARARLANPLLQDLLLNAEAPSRNQVPRIGDRRVGEGLADDGDLEAAALEALRGLENRLVPLGVAHIAGQEGKVERLDQFLDTLGAVGELPMGGHGLDTQRVHGFHHVRAAALERGIRPLPGVAAIEDQRFVGAEARQEIGAGHVRRQPCRLADADVDGRLAEVDRHQLGVEIRQVKQRHLTQGLESQKLILCDRLARRCPNQSRRAAHQDGGRGHGLKEVTAVKHHPVRSSSAGKQRGRL
jgi:hypothetical protein